MAPHSASGRWKRSLFKLLYILWSSACLFLLPNFLFSCALLPAPTHANDDDDPNASEHNHRDSAPLTSLIATAFAALATAPAAYAFASYHSSPFPRQRNSSSFSLVILFFIEGAALAYFLAVCLGSPVFDKALCTLCMSLFLSSTIVVPVATRFHFNVSQIMDAVFAFNWPDSDDAFFVWSAIAATVLAWASSCVIPLDWDRVWQTYPIPAVLGCWIGNTLSMAFQLAWSVLRDIIDFSLDTSSSATHLKQF